MDDFLSHDIDVLPRTTNCQLQEKDELCINIPGCIYCLWQNNEIRTLQQLDSQDSSSPDEADQQGLQAELDYYYNSRRRLYPKILPDFAGINDDEILAGYCMEGFRNSACPLDVSTGYVMRSSRYYLLACFICLFCLFL